MNAFVGQDDFARRVYCILGAPVDDIAMAGLVNRIHQACAARDRQFISTPNLNFLMLSQHDRNFRRSILESDICPADGVGVLLICKLLGVPITSRVSGADLPAALQASRNHASPSPLRMTFFGGDPGVGERACNALNAGNGDHVICVAAIDPGVMTAEKMSDTSMVDRINATDADFLLVALGAQKGQAWLLRNLEALNVPVASHLGATLNFLAGSIKRAPVVMRKLGLEWLWRIKEEPYLATRYLADGAELLWLALTRIVPLGLWLRWHRGGHTRQALGVWLDADQAEQSRIIISGAARDDQLRPIAASFRSAAQAGLGIVLDLRALQFFGMGFAGQVLMLEKAALRQNLSLSIVGARPAIVRALGWCGLKHLIGKDDT